MYFKPSHPVRGQWSEPGPGPASSHLRTQTYAFPGPNYFRNVQIRKIYLLPGQPPPTAVPSLLPSGSSERRGRFPPAASHSLASRARCCRVPPCLSHGPSTGLGAAARDRVPSASRGRREAASCALRPLPLGCCRRRHLAASAWRGGGGGAPGLRAPAPPPAGNEGGWGRANGQPGPGESIGPPLLAACALGVRPRRSCHCVSPIWALDGKESLVWSPPSAPGGTS